MNNKEFSFPGWPSFTCEEVEAVSKVLSSNKVNYWTGTEAREFEVEFAQFAESKYAIALSNGTVALDLALNALGIGDGDEVIVTSRTFIASVSSIVNAGAIPVFADVDLESQNITPSTIKNVLTAKTKAILCVHLAGWPCEMDSILELAEAHDLRVIEDCAQAHGAKYKGRSVGSFGDVGAWSFCQDKIMTTGGEGGMVTTNSKELWDRMWSFKDHGKSWEVVYNTEHPPGFRWLHESFGTNWRITEMQACIGRIQLKRMDDWSSKRRSNSKAIDESVALYPIVRAIRVPDYVSHARYKHYLFVRPEMLAEGWSRDRIVEEISSRGLPCYQGSCSEVYLEKAFDNTSWRPKDRLKNAKMLGETSLMLLVHPTITKESMAHYCSVICDVLESAQRSI